MAAIKVTREQIEKLWYDDALNNKEIAKTLGLSAIGLWRVKNFYSLPDRCEAREANDPDEAAIAAMCEEIRATWSPEETAMRRVGARRRPLMPTAFQFNRDRFVEVAR